MKAIRLKTEHLFDPVGVDFSAPRLFWDQETVRSSRTTRTKSPLKSTISEGFSYSLSTAAQEVSLSFSA